MRHEDSDVNARAILWTAFGLVTTVVVTCLAAWWLFNYYQRRDERRNAGVPSLVAEGSSRPLGDRVRELPGPRLEGLEHIAGIEPVDVAALRAWGEARLSRYGWVEKDKVAHIPIDSAMKAILSEGLRDRYLPAAKEGEGRGGKGRTETGRGTRGEKR
jgi:hypothetical protein